MSRLCIQSQLREVNFVAIRLESLNTSLDTTRDWLAQNVQAWLSPLIVLAILGSCFLFPMMGYELLLIVPIALIVLGVVFLLFMQRPRLAVVTLIINALLSPSPYMPGAFNLAVLHLMLLVGLWIFLAFVQRQPVQWSRSRPLMPLIGLVGTAIISFGLGQLSWFRFADHAPLIAQLGGLLIFILAAGAFLFVGYRFQNLADLQWITWVYIALAALFIAGWLVPGLSAFTGRHFQRGATSNSMFWVWIVSLSFGQALFNRRLPTGWRLGLMGLIGATLYIAYFYNSSWKSGYLPPLVAIFAVLACRSWRLGLVLALMAVVPAAYLGSEAIATDQYSYSTRLDAWIIVLEIVKVNPIFGLGPANYYWYTPLFPIRGYAVQFNSHSQYVDIIAQVGIVGLLFFAWFAWEIGWLGWKLRTRAPEGFARGYVYGVLGGLAGTLASGVLADWFLPFVYNITLNGFRGGMLPWLFLGGLITLERIVNRTEETTATTAATTTTSPEKLLSTG